MKLICPTCKGNGFVKVASFEHDEMIHQCWDCDSEGEFMRLRIILLVTAIVIITTSCIKDFNLNPWTTVIKEVIKNDSRD